MHMISQHRFWLLSLLFNLYVQQTPKDKKASLVVHAPVDKVQLSYSELLSIECLTNFLCYCIFCASMFFSHLCQFHHNSFKFWQFICYAIRGWLFWSTYWNIIAVLHCNSGWLSYSYHDQYIRSSWYKPINYRMGPCSYWIFFPFLAFYYGMHKGFFYRTKGQYYLLYISKNQTLSVYYKRNM